MGLMYNTRNGWALVALSMASSFVFAELVMVSTILSAIQVHLNANYIQLQWILNIYILVTAVFMITMGRFGDVFGNRVMALLGMAGFGLSSFFAGLSNNPEWMIIARAFQGFFGALIIPCSLALVNNLFPDDQKGKVIGIWNALAMLGIALAPLIATVLHKFADWRWIFFINIPLMLVCMIITVFSLREEPIVHEKTPIDWWGFVFLTIGASCVVIAVTQGFIWGWASPSTLILLVSGVIAIFLWIVTEMTENSPIINFGWFANKTFASCIFIAIISTSAGVVLLFLVPLYLHNILEISYIRVGLYLFALTFPTVLFSPLAGYLTDKWGHRLPIIIGSLFFIISTFMITQFSRATAHWFLVVTFLIFGMSWGLIMGPVKVGVLNSLPHRKSGVGIGALLSFEHLGATIFLAIMGTVFRHSEVLFLDDGLRSAGIDMTKSRAAMIQNLLAHPLKVQQNIQNMSVELQEKIIPLFKASFLHGFHTTFLSVLAFAFLAFLMFLFIKQKQH